jgi:hypothetical protein
MSNDPIFAVIAEHRRIYRAWNRARPNEDLFDLYAEASGRLCRTTPTTADGVLALLDYVISKRYDDSYWAQGGFAFYRPLLNSIREGLRANGSGHNAAA